MSESVLHPDFADDEPEDDWPYCECELDAVEDELASNRCSACGKPLH